MQVQVNGDRCQGHGRCFLESPEVFEPDDEGYATVTNAHPPETIAAAVRNAVDSCPEQAIELTG